MAEQPKNQDRSTPADTTLPVLEEGLDPANQSLSDALRISFTILKFVMAFIVIAFACSGFFSVKQNESAMVLRFGKLKTEGDAVVVYEPGFTVALPEPIDEKVKIRTDTRHLTINTFAIDPNAAGHYGGLIPGLDGYMITADQNLVHAAWTILYRIDDPATFVNTVVDAEHGDDEHGSGKPLVRTIMENTVLRKAARYSSSDILLHKTEAFRSDVRNEVSEKLKPFGIYVIDVRPKGRMTPPMAVIGAWNARTAAAQTRAKDIQKAVSLRSTMLSDTAGAIYPELLEKLDRYEQARTDNKEKLAATLEKEIQSLMLTDAAGRTARRLSAARAFQTGVYEIMRGDVRRFNQLLPEYQKNPETVAARLWTETKTELLSKAEGKLYAIPGQGLVIEIRPDPKWKREDEKKAYRKEAE